MLARSSGYDKAGNVLFDGVSTYVYDGEGRICAVKSEPIPGTYVMTEYIYDSQGNRVGKGTITTPSCNKSTNGFVAKAGYVTGLNGEQMTETNGTPQWVHTNVFANGSLIATYHDTSLYFSFEDWLGTKRAEGGVLSSGTCLNTYYSLPFGNDLTTKDSGCPDATEHHFTQKERDAESGNDYFEARYYTSAFGRFMSPDWTAKEEDDDPVPYAVLDDPQSLNLYAYVRNNPLTRVDATGHATCANPPSCTMSTIDTRPAGEKGPAITFKNDDPNGKSPNQPVTTKTAVMVEKAVIKSGVKSVNINSTTGGKHAATSNHAKGRAVDIDTVNGTPVRSQGASPAVKSLQGAFAESPDVRENFGPSRMEKTSAPGGAAQPFGNSKLTEDHEGHIHESSQP